MAADGQHRHVTRCILSIGYRRDFPELNLRSDNTRGAHHSAVVADHQRPEGGGHLAVAQALNRDFRADPRWVAQRHRQ